MTLLFKSSDGYMDVDHVTLLFKSSHGHMDVM